MFTDSGRDKTVPYSLVIRIQYCMKTPSTKQRSLYTVRRQKYRKMLVNKVSILIITYIDHIKLAAYMVVSLSHSFIFFWFYFIIVYMVVCFVCFCLIFKILYSYCNVLLIVCYVFLLLCILIVTFMYFYCYVCSVPCIVSLCCFMYCLCVNVYRTTATDCQPNCS